MDYFFKFAGPMIVLVVLCSVVIWFAIRLPVEKQNKFKYLGYRTTKSSDVILEFENQRGERVEYCGSCTVWRSLPSYRRCGTFTESFLCDMWTKHVKYGVPPDA